MNPLLVCWLDYVLFLCLNLSNNTRLIRILMLQDKTFGKIIFKHGGTLILYRGRNYNPKKRPVIPLMLWKPHEPVYPRLIKSTIEGLSVNETKEMRKRGLAVPALTKLGMLIIFSNFSCQYVFEKFIDSVVNCSQKWLLCFFGTDGQRCFPLL